MPSLQRDTSTVINTQQLQGSSEVPGLLAGILVPEIVCSFIILGRIYSRGILIKNWGWDDTLIILAWICSLTVVTLVGVESHFGLGHKHKDIPLRYQAIAIKCSYFTIIFYQACLLITKLSILFFYLRILKLRLQRILIWSTISFVCTYGAVLIPFSALVCNPITQRFPFSPNGKCFSYYPIMTASAIIHTSTDVWLIALVIPHILKMSILRRQKLGLAFLLTLGLFDACASLTRISVAYRFLNRHLAQWDSFSFAIWTTLETSLGIICASAPMLRPMVRQILGKKPTSAPEMAPGNVPRSKGEKKKAGRARDESLWSGLHEQHEQEVQMREAVQAAGKDFLTVHVMGEGEGERSASVSTAGGSAVKVSSMV
jgi:hypothetical protein